MPHNDSTSQKSEIIPLIVPYDSNTYKLRNIIRKHWCIIQEDTLLKKLFPRPPTLAIQRRKNIADHIIRAKSFTPDEINPEIQAKYHYHITMVVNPLWVPVMRP